MGFLDDLFRKAKRDHWHPTHRATINYVTFDEIRNALGRPTKSKDGFTFWTGSMDTIDPDYLEDEFYQLSNYNWRFGTDQTPKLENREQWYIYATSPQSIRQIADEVGGMARNIEEV